MKPFWQITSILLGFPLPVFGQVEDTLPAGAVAERFVAASPSVRSFRPVGEYRTWAFYAKQTTFGQLTSAVTGGREIDGREVVILRESLQIDYTKLGFENQISLSGETYVTERGEFAGCDYWTGAKESGDRLVLEAGDSKLRGYYTRGESKNEVDLPHSITTMPWDSYMIDQLEIFLALRDLQIGSSLDDSVFLPQSLVKAHVVGQVIWFMWQEIYKGRIDSVFIIRLTEPASYQLYFTPDKKLVRVDMLDQNIRVYQDIVRQLPANRASQTDLPSRPPFSFKLLILKLPHYVVFLIFGAATLLLLAFRAFKWSVSYSALVAGAVLYIPVVFLVNPFLIFVARQWLALSPALGSALYTRGAVLPLLTALIHAALFVGGLIILKRLFGIPPYRLVGLGAFLGAGFGLAESVYLSGFRITILFDWPLLERASMIVLHTAAGAVLGRFLRENVTYLAWAVLGIVAVGGAARYLPLLVQTRLIDIELMHFVLTFWVAAFLIVVLILSRKPLVRAAESIEVEDGPVRS